MAKKKPNKAAPEKTAPKASKEAASEASAESSYDAIKSAYVLIENVIQRFIDERIAGAINASLIKSIVGGEPPDLADIEERLSQVQFGGLSVSELIERTDRFLAEIKSSIE